MSNMHEQLWKSCLSIIKDNINEASYNTWFAPIVPVKFDNKVFVLQVPSQFFVEYIEEKYIDLLRMTLIRVTGTGTRLEYCVLIDQNSNAGTQIPSTAEHKAHQFSNNHATTNTITSPYQRIQLPEIDPQLNPAYNFNNLIEGKSNKLARTAGISIADDPGKTIFNPLFVYGKSGVGKTHLANAIGLMTKQLHPEKRVLYVSANTFQIQYTDAVRNNTQNDFLNFYQTIDVLLIDDIQEFSGKPERKTRFHIFNHLHQTGKQLVLTSDRSPLEMVGMEQRLLTRFKWGLSAEIEKPDFELRKSILNNKIYHDGLEIPENVVDYIAENVVDNVRDLEGVLISLLAHSTLTNLPIDISLAEKVISRIVNITPKVMTVEHIRDTVCDYFKLSVDAISTGRNWKLYKPAKLPCIFLKC